ncbi:branched-chain amino acid transport system ATP-binding protein [Rhodoligotrophos appendicifer]|uniref:ABC transporter ATP-binding protein n=1 Tax=Rhodoligotrophos appendicifer TaxID=987056 RepID=UPI0019613428|nr:ABC transporter ATP-binding protein [Rhodoligotrophos appendicifer]
MSPLLSMRNVKAGYAGAIALEDISIDVNEGEVVCLLGANGAGKTTTMAVLTGLIGTMAGQIEFDGRDLLAMPSHDRVAAGLALSPEGRKVFPNLTVHENLILGSYNSRARKGRKEKLEEVFALFPKLVERREQKAGLMSGGEQQMLAIGRALMANPRLLLLDEPSLGLAPKIVQVVFAAIRQIARSNTTILLVEQNTRAALSVAHRGYVISSGSIVYSASARELKTSAMVQEAFIGSDKETAHA